MQRANPPGPPTRAAAIQSIKPQKISVMACFSRSKSPPLLVTDKNCQYMFSWHIIPRRCPGIKFTCKINCAFFSGRWICRPGYVISKCNFAGHTCGPCEKIRLRKRPRFQLSWLLFGWMANAADHMLCSVCFC